jgi:hypothetical protein
MNDSIEEDRHGQSKGHEERHEEKADEISKRKEKGEAGKEKRKRTGLGGAMPASGCCLFSSGGQTGVSACSRGFFKVTGL